MSKIRSLTPLLTIEQHRTLFKRSSINWFPIRNTGQVGDVVAVSVGVAAVEGLAAAGDGRPTLRQNSWESPITFHNRNKAAEAMTRIIRPLYRVLRDVLRGLLIKAALIVGRLCHRLVSPSWVESCSDHKVDIVYPFLLNLCPRRMKIHVETTHSICEYIPHRVFDVS